MFPARQLLITSLSLRRRAPRTLRRYARSITACSKLVNPASESAVMGEARHVASKLRAILPFRIAGRKGDEASRSARPKLGRQ
jgi:hypothetical protein